MYTVACQTWGAFKEHLLRYAALSRAVRSGYIFRGHNDSTWRLDSTLDRQFAHLDVTQRAAKLKGLLKQFAQELSGIDDREVIQDSERLELIGRHHGLPTTVLDWSRSPYVAAYTIPHSERTLALSDLDEMLITAKTLFRDRDAAARTAIIRESLP